MRLFVALQIPSDVREQIASLIKELRQDSPQSSGDSPKWIRPQNLHVTLKFIGEVPAENLAPIRNALAHIPPGKQIALEFRGLGFFPNEQNPRVLWMGIADSSNVKTFAASIDLALEHVGIPREHRAFQPHLTLARFASCGPNAKLRASIARNWARGFGSLRAKDFHLMESKLKSSGAEYTTVQSFPFAETEA